jgi:hypothetical protein
VAALLGDDQRLIDQVPEQWQDLFSGTPSPADCFGRDRAEAARLNCQTT